MVGAALLRDLKERGATDIIFQTKESLDLRDQAATRAFFEREKPSYVFLSAAKMGGIGAHQLAPAEFLYDNLMIVSHVIHAAYSSGVKKLLFLASSAVYPRCTPQPIREEQLLSAPLDSTNEGYALAKMAGMKLCETYRDQYGCNFISAVVTNLYGPGDSYDLEKAHVLPALLRKVHEAKQLCSPSVEVWGSGTSKREFMHVDDLSRACLLFMESYEAQPQMSPSFINLGVGEDLSISALAHLIKKIVKYEGTLLFNPSKPEGAPRKRLDVSRLTSLGFRPSISLEAGIRSTYADYLERLQSK